MKDEDIGQTLADEARRAERDESREEERHPYRRPPPAREPSQVYSLRIPVDRLEDLRRIAATAGEAPSALMRSWVLEHLDRSAGIPAHVIRLIPEADDRLRKNADRAGLSPEEYAGQLLTQALAAKDPSGVGSKERDPRRLRPT